CTLWHVREAAHAPGKETYAVFDFGHGETAAHLSPGTQLSRLEGAGRIRNGAQKFYAGAQRNSGYRGARFQSRARLLERQMTDSAQQVGKRASFSRVFDRTQTLVDFLAQLAV